MKKVVYDLFTGYVRGIDRDPLPAEGTVDLPYPIYLSKTIDEKTGNMVQKVNDQGELLYKDNVSVDEVTGGESFDEVTTPQKVTTYEAVTNTYKIVVGETPEERIDEEGEPITVMVPVYEEIHPESRVPVEWVDLEPVMVEEVVSRAYTIEQNPFIFTWHEVEAARALSIEEAQNAPPSDIELLHIEQAQSNTEIIDLMMAMLGGV